MYYYTECLRPEGLEPELFANRDALRVDLKHRIDTAIKAKGIEGIRFLGTGERGVGKSILFRKVLRELHQEGDFILVEIDGRECRDELELLKNLCRTMCGALRDRFRDDGSRLFAEAAYIEDIVEKSKITRRNALSIMKGTKIESGIEIGTGLVPFLKAKLGITDESAKSEEVSDEYEFDINVPFLRDLLNSVIKNIGVEQKFLFFIDNLDQVYEKDTISNFLKSLLAIKKPIVVITVRTEALSNELRRDFRRIVPVEELDEEGLIEVIRKRLEVCDEEDITDIDEARLFEVADILKTLTGNPLAFLTWIEFLCNNTELNPETAIEDLKRYTDTHFSDFLPGELEKIIKFFLKQDNDYKGKEDILKGGFSKGFCERLRERGVLIPNDIYKPRYYKIAPEFVFFKKL